MISSYMFQGDERGSNPDEEAGFLNAMFVKYYRKFSSKVPLLFPHAQYKREKIARPDPTGWQDGPNYSSR